MIATNMRFKTEIDKIKKSDINKEMIKETDSVNSDSTYHVKINIH